MSSVSSLIFCLDSVSMVESRALKSPTIIVLLSISPFRSITIWLKILGWVHIHLQLLYSYAEFPLDHYIKTFFVSYYSFWLSLFCLISIAYPVPLLVSLCIDYLFPFLHFEFMCILKAKVSLLLGAHNCVLLLFACFLIYSVILSFDLRI